MTLTLVSFVGVLGNDFVYLDDNLYVLDNRVVRAGLTAKGAWLALTRSYAGNWHPLAWFSHMLDVEFFGLAPAGHHAVSVAVHGLNAVLFYLVFRRMTGRRAASGLAAALFAVHPLHVESVAWVAERKDVLCGLFWALTLAAYARYAERLDGVGYAAVCAAYSLCLMAKPMGVTLPLVLLLLDGWPLGRAGRGVRLSVPDGDPRAFGKGPWRWRPPPLLLEKAPLFGLAAVASVIAYTAQAKAEAVTSLDGYDMTSRVANALLSYGRYLEKTVWPVRLAVFYPYEPLSLLDGRVLAAALGLAAVSAVAWRLRGRLPYLWMGWLWYLVTLLPVIGLLQVGNQAMADRYTYLPLLGPFLALGCGLEDLAARLPPLRRPVGAAAGAAVLALAATTAVQTTHWRNTETLFAQALRATEANWFAHNNYAGALLAQGRDEEAILHLREALRINPRYRKAQRNLAMALERTDRSEAGAPGDREPARTEAGRGNLSAEDRR
jgi:hypothetical protein